MWLRGFAQIILFFLHFFRFTNLVIFHHQKTYWVGILYAKILPQFIITLSETLQASFYSCSRACDFGFRPDIFITFFSLLCELSHFSPSNENSSMYLLCATPKVFHELFWNYAGFYFMICRCAFRNFAQMTFITFINFVIFQHQKTFWHRFYYYSSFFQMFSRCGYNFGSMSDNCWTFFSHYFQAYFFRTKN